MTHRHDPWSKSKWVTSSSPFESFDYCALDIEYKPGQIHLLQLLAASERAFFRKYKVFWKKCESGELKDFRVSRSYPEILPKSIFYNQLRGFLVHISSLLTPVSFPSCSQTNPSWCHTQLQRVAMMVSSSLIKQARGALGACVSHQINLGNFNCLYYSVGLCSAYILLVPACSWWGPHSRLSLEKLKELLDLSVHFAIDL